MPIRTSAEIMWKINTDIDQDVDQTEHIRIASRLVDRHCATKVDGSGVPIYDTQDLTDIETYLALHFAALDDPKSTSDWIGMVRSTYETNKVDLGLDLTRYGSTAKVLDAPGGGLAAIDAISKSNGAVPSLFWAGEEDDEEEEVG